MKIFNDLLSTYFLITFLLAILLLLFYQKYKKYRRQIAKSENVKETAVVKNFITRKEIEMSVTQIEKKIRLYKISSIVFWLIVAINVIIEVILNYV